MPMPNLRDATPAQRARALVGFVVGLAIVVIIVVLVR
jgi:hypothetical protein